MAKLARMYVVLLFVLEWLLFAASLLLHISLWIGVRSYTSVPESLFVGGLITGLVTAFLAKDRNVWQNEFKSCPIWARVLTLAFVLYGFIEAFSRTVLFPDVEGSAELFTVSALSLSIDAMSLCILYAVLWRSSEQEEQLLKRSRNSFLAAILGSAYLLARHAGYLPQQNR